MARNIAFAYIERPKKRRPGVHAKTKSSKLKSSKNYLKRYRGQGRYIIYIFVLIKFNLMDIRKISIGQDYKSSAMHYIVGQEV